MLTAIAIAAAYLVGSIPTGVIVGRIAGFDPRTVGSGNIGMSNVARAGGGRAAAITLIGDMLKGLIPVMIASRYSGGDPRFIAAVALAAFIGAICSIFLGFSGGKGVGCSVGIWLYLSPLSLAISLFVFLVVFAVWRFMSLSSISAALALVPITIVLSLPRSYVALAIVMAALVVFRHQENIGRLMHGEEPAFGAKRAVS